MIPKDERTVRRVCGSAIRAFLGESLPTLRAYSFAIDQKGHRIRLRAHFGGQPSEDELEDISAIETEILADFLDDFTTETDVEIVPQGKPLALLADGIAYLRQGEPGVICRKWTLTEEEAWQRDQASKHK